METLTKKNKTVRSTKTAVEPNTTLKITAPLSKKNSKTTEKKTVDIGSLTQQEIMVLTFVAFNLKSWRKNEPTYSNVGDTDITKAFKWDKKNTASVISSLTEKGFLYEAEGFKGTVHVSWDKVPEDFGNVAPEIKQSSKKETASKSASKAKQVKSFAPYQKFGVHGENKPLEGFAEGDPILFELKNKKVKGEYRHLHINNHSPKGYVVIRYNGATYERVPSKVWPVEQKVSAPTKSVKQSSKKTTASAAKPADKKKALKKVKEA